MNTLDILGSTFTKLIGFLFNRFDREIEQIYCNIDPSDRTQFHTIDRELEQICCNIHPSSFTKLIGKWNKFTATYTLLVSQK